MVEARLAWFALGTLVFCVRPLALAQTLVLPERALHAPSGHAFASSIEPLAPAQREQAILGQVLSGNVPDFLRRFCPVTVTNVADGRTNRATFFAAPEYLCVGSNDDALLVPLTPMTAQHLVDQLGCCLPTRKMTDAIHAAAKVQLPPAPIPPSPAMTTVPVFVAHNDVVRTQRLAWLATQPLGSLVAGHKKDVVVSAGLARTPHKVAIYGWHQTNGVAIQPLYSGHTVNWVDYSHGVRLVQQTLQVNGSTASVAQVLADPSLAGLLSDEGALAQSRYATNPPAPLPDRDHRSPTTAVEFNPTGAFGEQTADVALDPGVTVHLNAPGVEDFPPDKPVLLVLYALPNGNTTAQTIGRAPRPGDDWRFDAQHIGAQVRFLRALATNHTVVIAYLEANTRSWPAWRHQHGDHAIPDLIARVKRVLPNHQLELVLTGHSGGGSLTFGYLNALDEIPSDVVRIAFLDSTYAFDAARGHATKLARWLDTGDRRCLCVFAYNDAVALLDGKPFVSPEGGTWGRSHAMLAALRASFAISSRTNAAGLHLHSALGGRVQFLLQENPERRILHTVLVERNGLMHALLAGTSDENRGYEYLGERAYTRWIATE